MGRKDLVNELIEFIDRYRLFSNAENLRMARDKIERQLENSVFVEGLIQTLIVKARYLDNVDFEQLKRLLIGLEEIRLELEYRD
jgi:hypothetical protein